MHKLDGRGPDADQNHHQHEGFLQPALSGEPMTAGGAGCLVCKVPESGLAAELALVLVRHVELVVDQWFSIGSSSASFVTDLDSTVDRQESQAEGARIPMCSGSLREESH